MGRLWPAGAVWSKAARQSVEVATASVQVATASLRVVAAAGWRWRRRGCAALAVTVTVICRDPVKSSAVGDRGGDGVGAGGQGARELPPVPISPARFDVHRNDPLRLPCCGSLADPEKAIVVPSPYEALLPGDAIVTDGAVFVGGPEPRRGVHRFNPSDIIRRQRPPRRVAVTGDVGIHRGLGD